MTKSKQTALSAVKICCGVLDEKKAEGLKILDVSAHSSITDYILLATATSEPHLRALRVEIEKALDACGTRIVGIEMAQDSGWVVIDVFDVMIHLFLAPVREHYSLERLWSDAAELPLSKVLAGDLQKRPKPRSTKTPAGKGRKGRVRKTNK